MALAPIAMAVTVWQSKRKKTREAIDATNKYEAELADFRGRAGALRNEERDRKREVSHCGGVALLLASTWHRRLWERAPATRTSSASPSGLGLEPSAIEADDPDGELDDQLVGQPHSRPTC